MATIMTSFLARIHNLERVAGVFTDDHPESFFASEWQCNVRACVCSRAVTNIYGLSMHLLEAGFDGPNRPFVLHLHGFLDLCYGGR